MPGNLNHSDDKIILRQYFDKMLGFFGKLHWWPGDTPFEVIVGAILTQNTAWINVSKSIAELKKNNLMNPQKLWEIPEENLAQIIKSSGYYNQKAKKIKYFLRFFKEKYSFSIENMQHIPIQQLRAELLNIKGIGCETADSILLYAINKPSFVVDAYTKRIFSRHGLIKETDTYETIRLFFQNSLPEDLYLYNEYHALIVNTGKYFCRKKPLCAGCPLEEFLNKGNKCFEQS